MRARGKRIHPPGLRLGKRLRRHPRLAQALLRAGVVRLLDREGLRRRAQADGSLIELDEPATAVDPELLRGPIQPPPPAAERARRRISAPPPWSLEPGFVCELRDVTLVGRKPLVYTADGELVLDALTATRAGSRRLEHSLRGLVASHGLRRTASGFTGRHRVSGPDLGHVCLLSSGLQRSYYHWTLEQLLKLRAVEEYTRLTGERPTIVLPKGRNPWMRELLELVGHGNVETVNWWRRGARADRLVLPTYPDPTPGACAWLRERVLERVGEVGPAAGERILVLRDDARRWWKRALVNQEELEAALRPLGFRPHRLAGMPVAEQVRLFARAEAVVSPHGAGLTNLVFSRTPTVVELFGRDVRPHYFRLATVLGLDYHYLLCGPATAAGLRRAQRSWPRGEAPSAPKPSGTVDETKLPGIEVDVSAVLRLLAEAGIA